MRKLYFLFLFLPLFVAAQIPTGYYNNAIGLSGAALKTKLSKRARIHTELGYGDLWVAFRTTDVRSDGKVWDMYSNCPFIFGTNQDSGSGGSDECQYYNREHSFPKSWFNDATPMYTDIFHLYPTDKKVNKQRGNYPYGETITPSDITLNRSKLGNCTFPGYSGIVFEPIDEYKGDFARTYFYMVTAYDSIVATWSSDQLAGNQYPALSAWSVNLFLKWSRQDPVSVKEINRNNEIYKNYQHNRNPFIDYPELAEHIWGTKKGIPWSLTSELTSVKIVFSISPNPVQHVLNIKSDEQDLRYTIFNLNGQVLASQALNGQTSISTEELNNGMYLLQLSSGNRKSIQKFIVNK